MHLSKIFFITLFLTAIFLLTGCSQVDTSQCDDLTPTDTNGKIACYQELAAKTLNMDVCDKIKEIKEPAFAQETFLKLSDDCKLSVIDVSNSTDTKQCEEFSNPGAKATCYLITVVESETPSLCEKAEGSGGFDEEPGGDEDSDDTCVTEIAIRQKNIDLCNTINQYVKEDYYEEGKQQRIDRCLYSYAGRIKDPTICNFAGTFKDNCYKNFAEMLQDESYCAEISKEARGEGLLSLRNSCFQDQAIRKRNKQICNTIEAVKIPPTNNLGPLAALFPSDPLYLRKSCYDAVDRSMGIVVPTPTSIGSPII